MRRALLILGAGVIAIVGAYFLRDAIYQTVIVPLAYIFWLLKFYYSSVPQIILWGLLLVILLFAILSNVLPEERSAERKTEKHRPQKGNVETLAGWLIKADKGTYFKWQIANRLGRINFELRERSERRARFGSANEAVEKYLDAGVTTSFVDYPNRKSALTPLDINPEEVVNYLEGLMENHRG